MNRPLHIWSIFAVCALVLLSAVTWVTSTALRLEKAQLQAQRAAEYEEQVRLALWRMDSLLTPIIVEESARPASHYRAFTSAGPIPVKGGTVMSDIMLPSPLLSYGPSHALLYFEVAPNGAINSPRVASSATRVALTGYITDKSLKESSTRLEQFKRLLSDPVVDSSQMFAANNGMLLSNVATLTVTNFLPQIYTNTLLAGNQQAEQVPAQQALNFNPVEVREQNRQVQAIRSSTEFQARNNIYQQVAQAGINAAFENQRKVVPTSGSVPAGGIQAEAPMTPLWLGSALVLARRANAPEGSVIQGVWLNWENLKQRLKENVRDLFPEADMRAATGTNGYGGRRLAALPVEFAPGATAQTSLPTWTSAQLTLALAWGGILMAVLAVAALLYGAVSLSERRGAFVSAVTHELRTPLTTFKMYSEMLAAGMVPEETKRQHYLSTLCSEANRLSHLVENVLAYARLERGSARTRVERISLGDLIARALPRLRERAERSEMELIVDADEPALQTLVHVDAAAVEQILFNLVDNACKYAAPSAQEKMIHLEALPDGKFAMLRVRDHGQGISAESAKRLFKPFSKSAQEAAHTAPGIGLGLALCRRLSRSLGGDLRLIGSAAQGACFELRLPLGSGGEVALDSI